MSATPGFGAAWPWPIWPSVRESRPARSRLEKGQPGVAIAALAHVLVALGLLERLASLIDVRNDDLGLALDEARLPKRGRSVSVRMDRSSARRRKGTSSVDDPIDPDGVAF